MQITRLADDQILGNLQRLSKKENTLIACVIGHLVEVERRKLYLKAACSSLYSYCIERLGYSEDETNRRIVATRLSLRFPLVLAKLETGEVSLSVLVLLRPHLNADNCLGLLSRVAHKSKRQVEHILATLAPKPEVPAMINGQPAETLLTHRAHPTAPTPPSTTTLATMPLTPTRAEYLAVVHDVSPATLPQPKSSKVASGPQPTEKQQITSYTSPPSPRKPFDQPLSEHRHRVEFTASTALRDKLERARDLMTTRNPRDQFAAVIESAVDLLLAKLEKERLGKLTRAPKNKANADPKDARATSPVEDVAGEGRKPISPQTSLRKNASGRITRAVRRAAFERDGEQCSFVDEEGHRCTARTRLEVDHIHPRALGGLGSDISNARILCRSHNSYEAARVFGKDHIERRILESRLGSRLKD